MRNFRHVMDRDYITVVDGENRVVGHHPSNTVHEFLLPHRAVHLLLFADTKLLIQRRALGKRVFPGYWDLSVAGHVRGEESYVEAARREAQEELGIEIEEIELITVYTPARENGFEFCGLCLAELPDSPPHQL